MLMEGVVEEQELPCCLLFWGMVVASIDFVMNGKMRMCTDWEVG